MILVFRIRKIKKRKRNIKKRFRTIIKICIWKRKQENQEHVNHNQKD
jgi:hypothetical protein